jgi:hypothetical protein
MAERSSGESITAFRWFTIPQTTDNLSLIFSNGSTNFGHVGSPLVSNSTKLLSYTYHRIITSRKIFNSFSELQYKTIARTKKKQEKDPKLNTTYQLVQE